MSILVEGSNKKNYKGVEYNEMANFESNLPNSGKFNALINDNEEFDIDLEEIEDRIESLIEIVTELEDSIPIPS